MAKQSLNAGNWLKSFAAWWEAYNKVLQAVGKAGSIVFRHLGDACEELTPVFAIIDTRRGPSEPRAAASTAPPADPDDTDDDPDDTDDDLDDTAGDLDDIDEGPGADIDLPPEPEGAPETHGDGGNAVALA